MIMSKDDPKRTMERALRIFANTPLQELKERYGDRIVVTEKDGTSLAETSVPDAGWATLRIDRGNPKNPVVGLYSGAENPFAEYRGGRLAYMDDHVGRQVVANVWKMAVQIKHPSSRGR